MRWEEGRRPYFGEVSVRENARGGGKVEVGSGKGEGRDGERDLLCAVDRVAVCPVYERLFAVEEYQL